MNNRIQVEHPVTECITGMDLVRAQIQIAAGEPLPFSQEDIRFSGHSIECRINAEDPETFIPQPGVITGFHAPGGPGVRVYSHIYYRYRVPPQYDAMICHQTCYVGFSDDATTTMRVAMAVIAHESSGIHVSKPPIHHS